MGFVTLGACRRQKNVDDDFTCTGSSFRASDKLQNKALANIIYSFTLDFSFELCGVRLLRCFYSPGNVCNTSELSQKFPLDLPYMPEPFHLSAQTAIRTSRVTKTSKISCKDSLRALTHREFTLRLSKDRSLQLSPGQSDRRSIYTTRRGHR